MLPTTTTILLSLFTLTTFGTTASPLSTRQWSKPYPPYTYAKYFSLVANISDPELAASTFPGVTPPASGWVLTSVHVGAGRNAAVLSPPRPEISGGQILFQNGTGRDISAAATSINLPPFETNSGVVVPWGIQFDRVGGSNVFEVGMNFGRGSVGAGIEGGLRNPYAEGFGPGVFVVCFQESPTYGRVQYGVKAVEGGNLVPEGCLRVGLFAQCIFGEIEGGLKGVEEFGWVNEGVGCYEDVGGIEWGLY
ncbi:hypothetical protein QBC44DRAFT_354382 [Cladorrhinum sp. PSN332]|nr:hypothetical protein QBC44DRAFT_354382 [Cladorrhinum sp. PSN332]